MRRPYRSRMRRPHPRGIRIALPTRSAIAVARRRRRPRGWRRKLSAHDHRHPPHRRCIRLRGYDYATTGAYFVTICTRDRLCLFGEIADDAMRLSAAGEIAAACWCEIPTHFTCVELDAFVTMPNHVHGIINIVGATHASPLPVRESPHGLHLPPRGPRPPSVGAVVGSFKSAVTRRLHGVMNVVGATQASLLAGKCRQSLWQRNYYEHTSATRRR